MRVAALASPQARPHLFVFLTVRYAVLIAFQYWSRIMLKTQRAGCIDTVV